MGRLGPRETPDKPRRSSQGNPKEVNVQPCPESTETILCTLHVPHALSSTSAALLLILGEYCAPFISLLITLEVLQIGANMAAFLGIANQAHFGRGARHVERSRVFQYNCFAFAPIL
jgi:hypothetical protein